MGARSRHQSVKEDKRRLKQAAKAAKKTAKREAKREEEKKERVEATEAGGTDVTGN